MRGALPRHVSPVPRARATMVAAVALLLLALPAAPSAFAATTTPATGADFSLPSGLPRIPANEKMLVESDQLVYDYDNKVVAAVGNVRIYYGGYTLEAARVSYNQGTGRLIATGNVRLTDPTGVTYQSEHIDITDDFRDGFVQSLKVDTPEQTHFLAERAERSGGETTTFINGEYTACEPCKEHPEKPPLWNVKAAQIVVDHKTHTVSFTDARLEVAGTPVVWLPYFSVADPSVKRKTGFLVPGAGYSGTLGAYASAPYYWALAPNYDVTFTPMIFSRQGPLGDIEWRHRLATGQYTIEGAGIYQFDPDAFASNMPGHRTWRGGVRTTGQFDLNQYWSWGWDGTLLTDRGFTRDYNLLTEQTAEQASTLYLTGLRDRNFFEARASYYQILTNQNVGAQYDQARQAFVAPVIDYQKTVDLLGGELTFTSNLANVMRAEDDPFSWNASLYHGTAGTTVRGTQEIAWRDQIITPVGMVLTPFASVRGDAFYLGGQTATAIGDGLTASADAYRFMPAVGVQASYPILITDGESSHVIEPIAQIIARPDATGYGSLPNNDAQSLVFDTSNLFDVDKFSGYDRVEGGTRANLGIRYTGTFASGASIDGAFGQSIQLAGANPFAQTDISNVGAFSGLETTFSDYVAGLAVDSGAGPRISAQGRFDNATFNINRAELEATTALGPVTASASYLYLRYNPNSDVTSEASVVRGAASVNIAENWRAFGTITYDIASSAIASDSFGIAFDNECLTASIAYNETRIGYTDLQPSRWLNFRLQLRTFGEANVTSNLSNLN